LRRRIIFVAILLAAVIAVVAVTRIAVVARDFDAIVTAERFDALRADHTELRAFLQRMPKGGDLHTHLSGAVYAERLIAWAEQNGLCLRASDLSIIDPPCDQDKGTAPIAEALREQHAFDRLVNSLSMRFFLPSAATPSGHDQFFATFGRFGSSINHPADMAADQLRLYQAEAVQYVEFMTTFLWAKDRRALAETIKGQTDFAAMLETLKANGLDRIVEGTRNDVAEQVKRIAALLDCDAGRRKPGCNVTYRYIVQIVRDTPIEEVFVQTAAAAALIRTEPRVVALNFVQAEDNRIARRDYSAHMRIIAFLAGDIPVTLHAGELWLGLVPPEDLTFHIREAVEIAGARRIGHGVALAFERDMAGLLAELRRRPVTIEICLTSNDLILGVRGADHPLTTYLAAGVPVVLSTDDAGVSRIDLTNEYVRAAREHGLGYRVLKAIARNALERAFLAEPQRRAELERFNRSSAEFEAAVMSATSWLQRLLTLLKAIVAPP
jgi:adenosine deaminase